MVDKPNKSGSTSSKSTSKSTSKTSAKSSVPAAKSNFGSSRGPTTVDDFKDDFGLYSSRAETVKPEKIGVEDVAPNPSAQPAEAAKPASFYDTLAPEDKADLRNTLIGEAVGEDDRGMAAVASVIKNRADIRGLSPAEVVRQPDQFSGYAKPGPQAKKAQSDPDQIARADKILAGVFNGEIPDETGGADYYHADYVSPYWAKSYNETGQIGRHQFYSSKAEKKQAEQTTDPVTVSALQNDAPEMARDAEDPFSAVLTQEPEADQPQPKQTDTPVLNYGNAGATRSKPVTENLSSRLTEAVSSVYGPGYKALVYSGGQNPLGIGGKRTGTVRHDDGKAADIYVVDPQGKRVTGDGLAPLAQYWAAKKYGGVGLEMRGGGIHLDEWETPPNGGGMAWNYADKGGTYTKGMDKAVKAGLAGQLPDMAMPVLNMGEPVTGAAQAKSKDKGPLQVESFSDDFGLYANEVPVPQQAPRGPAIDEFAAREDYQNSRETSRLDTKAQVAAELLAKDAPGRDFVTATPEEAAAIQADWLKNNKSTSRIGDIGLALGKGLETVKAAPAMLIDTLVANIPVVGPAIVEKLQDIDRWQFDGKTSQDVYEAEMARRNAAMSTQGKETAAKQWVDEKRNPDGTYSYSLGQAWKDPYSYVNGAAESVPSMVISMAPGGILARGAFTRAIASGATREEAAAIAAKYATVAGGINEGLQSGAQTSQQVRDAIKKIPVETLRQSDAYKSYIESGMSEQDALSAMTNDAATWGLITAGVTTSAFGGLGDRAIAKIVGEGITGGVASRVAKGAGKGFIGESIEEIAQSSGEQVAQNLGVQVADPSQRLSEGVPNAAAGGLAIGGAMGAGMGGPAGAISRADAPAAAEPSVAIAEAEPAPSGPIGRAVASSQRMTPQQAAASTQPFPDTAQAPAAASDTRPAVGSTVQVTAEGVEPFMGTVYSHEGDETLVMDSGTGELLQIPTSNLSTIAPSPTPAATGGGSSAGQAPVEQSAPTRKGRGRASAADQGISAIPEESSDPAFEPQAPQSGEVQSLLPPKTEQMPALERYYSVPKPGQRIIVDTPELGRFAATVESWEENRAEGVVKGENGVSYQVPSTVLYTSKLTDKQVEAQDLQRNPPVPRDPPEMTGKSRKLGNQVVNMPDDLHARLFDLGRERQASKNLAGKGNLSMDSAMPSIQRQLAKDFNVSPEAIGQIADDYRYRVERSVKTAKSQLPINMFPVNERLLKQRQADKRNSDANGTLDFEKPAQESPAQDQPAAEPTEQTPAQKQTELSNWWDGELTAKDRQKLLDRAGVKRNERVLWKNHSAAIKQKILAARDEVSGSKESGPKDAPKVDDTAPKVDEAAHQAATSPKNDKPEPTQAQKEAGNYEKGHVSIGGLDISIENPQGSSRSGVDPNGKSWSVKMQSHYGYIKGTVGKDKDHIDVFIKPGTDTLADNDPVFVVDQKNPKTGKFDEHKVMIGFSSPAQARKAYLANYSANWEGLGPITETTLGKFKDWLKSGDTTKQFSGQSQFLAPKLSETNFSDKTPAEIWINATPAERASFLTKATGENPIGTSAELHFKSWSNLDENTRKAISRWIHDGETSPAKISDTKKPNPATPAASKPIDFEDYPFDENYGSKDEAFMDGLNRLADVPGSAKIVQAVINGKTDAEILAIAAKVFTSGKETGKKYDISVTSRDPLTVKSVLRMPKGPEDNILTGKPLAALLRQAFNAVLPGDEQYFDPEPAKVDSKEANSEAITPASEVKRPFTLFDDGPDYHPVVKEINAGLTWLNSLSNSDFDIINRIYDIPGPRQAFGNSSMPTKLLSQMKENLEIEKRPAPKPDAQFAGNKVFTADKVAAARARLKAKLNQLNSGIDPEVFMDGITIAGAYIESGVRDFAKFAQAMTDDFGDNIKPFLLSFWEGTRNYPGVDKTGMTSVEESAKIFEGLISDVKPEENPAIGQIVKKAPTRKVKTGKSGDRQLVVDYGVDSIDAYSNEGEQAKAAFLKDAQGYLRAVADTLQDKGFTAFEDKKGRLKKPVYANPAGIAASGEVSLSMKSIENGASVYVQVGTASLRGVVPSSPSGITIMMRAAADGKEYGIQGGNQWVSPTLSVDELADMLVKGADNAIRANEAKKRMLADGQSAKLDQPSQGTLENKPAEQVPGIQGGGQTGRGATERSGTDVAGNKPVGTGGVQPGRGVADDAPRVPDAASGSVENKPLPSGALTSQARPVDYTITDEDKLGEGGQKAKFRANVDAIKILRTLDAEKRSATREEQSALAKWVGWGGLRPAFGRDDGTVNKGWEKEQRELKELLTPEELRAAESSTRNAHYTSAPIVKAAWDIANRLGFQGGQVLEPSVGSGNFLGMMPADKAGSSMVTGVELDHITGNIAKNLYPRANIVAPMGFEKLTVPDNHFDLAIGNPPFGSDKLYDKERRHLNSLSIHNFFFAKSVEALRPGGVLVMVVTNRFLDGNTTTAREMIAEKADLLGAIRLPNNAFLKNAGTEVTTDIVILRKRMPGEKPKGDWTKVTDYKGKDGKAVPLNQYFHDNPDMMLGDFGAYGTMYGPDEPALVTREGDDLPKLLKQAIANLPAGKMVSPGAPVAVEKIDVPNTVADAVIGSMFLAPDGTVHERIPDYLGKPQSKPVELKGEAAVSRVSGMIRIRDAFAKLRAAQINPNADDDVISNLRGRLNKFYDAFVEKYGPVNADGNRRLFRDDPTWPQVSALEDGFDKGVSAAVAKATGEKQRPASAKKAPIFTKRTQQPYTRPTSATSAQDALALTLADLGRVDLDHMEQLYGKNREQIIDELGSAVYQTPAGAFETSDQYLSGNVRQKLALAREKAQTDSAFRRNVTALEAVIPSDIEAVDINVKPGSPWIPAKHIADFVAHITESNQPSKPFYSSANAKWSIDVPRSSPAAEAQWGTSRVSLNKLMPSVLNGESVTVYDTHRDGTRTVDQPATDAANEKIEKLKSEWQSWIWSDDTRRDELSRIYNDVFNTDVLQAYDGSHLSLPGKVGDDIISLRPHQKNFVWRTMQSPTTLADHTVGAGKTFALIASAMEMRRTGQAKKPMFVVPNHLVGQWGSDFVKLYPGAKVLAATKKDFESENRKRLFARVASGDWDAVIVAHSSFGRIGVNAEFEEQFIKQQVSDLETSMTELRKNEGQKSRNISQLTKWRDNLNVKLQKLMNAGSKDTGMTFEEMGVDALFVDEAHEFKNLGFSTSMNRVAGLGNPTGSQKAADLYMKITSVLSRTGGRNIVFATGTPISNTMAEMYTMQRYLDGKGLKNLGVDHFDAWARVFGEVVADWELSPSGTYKMKSRFAKFVNIPELMQRYLSFADVINNDDIKAQLAAQGKKLPLPKVKGGKPEIVVVERSPDQARYIGEGVPNESGELVYPAGSLVHRAENLPKGKVMKGADNMLKVMSDARKAALDMRMINPSLPDAPGSKVHVAADNMLRLYNQWNEQRGTQLVFIDLSTPKKAQATEAAKIRALMAKAEDGDEAAQEALDKMSPDEFDVLDAKFSVYDDLRQKLIDRGIPEGEIAFIHDANTDLQKEELFGKVRSGKIRFMFGSTPKMGAGTNVQNRLVALHHLDAPWRPSDLEQRDGRGIRQGNELYNADPEGFEIEILRYATKNTLDARQWQTIEGKARFVQQLRKGGSKEREIEDIGGEAANAAEMKAAASGNPLILEEMDLKNKVRKLAAALKEHDREQFSLRRRITEMKDRQTRYEKRMPDVNADANSAQTIIETKAMPVLTGGKAVGKSKEFGEAIINTALEMMKSNTMSADVATFGDFAIGLEAKGFKASKNAFFVMVNGKRDYQVEVGDDVSVADPTGLSQRVINTIRKLVDEPAAYQNEINDISKNLPKMQAQLGAYPGAEELQKTEELHREILDKLKPKKKPAAAAPEVPKDAEPSINPDPSIEIRGDEVMSGFGGDKDFPALRKSAAKWYDENLRGSTAVMADGTEVRFSRQGMGKSTSDSKGDILLRSIPAIKPIIETGRVISREPGKNSSVLERVIVSAPVKFNGRVYDMAVSLHRVADGTLQYDLTFDRDGKTALSGDQPGVNSGGQGKTPVPGLEMLQSPERDREASIQQDDAEFNVDPATSPINLSIRSTSDAVATPVGWDFADGMDAKLLSKTEETELENIVKQVSGLSEVQWRNRIELPNGAAAWGSNTPSTAGGFYSPSRDIVALARDSANRGTAYHEAFHRLQNLFLTVKEMEVLAADMPRLRQIVRSKIGRENAAAVMSPKEVEAEAFAIYATGADTPVKLHKTIAGAWARIKDTIGRVRNWLEAKGYQITDDIFGKAMSGEIAARGSTPTEIKTNNQVFKQWFADSKVVDAGGAPLRVFHGTSKTFSRFDPSKAGKKGVNDAGIFFAEHPGTADYYAEYNWDTKKNRPADLLSRVGITENAPQVLPVYLSIKNPFVVTKLTDVPRDRALQDIKRKGYDGIKIDRPASEDGSNVHWIAFSPDQIRSVFEGDSFSVADGVTSTPAFKRWFGRSKIVDAQGKPVVAYHGGSDGAFKDGATYFASSADLASKHAIRSGWKPRNAAAVTAGYLSVQNPLIVDFKDKKSFDDLRLMTVAGTREQVRSPELSRLSIQERAISKAQAAGNDGVIFKNWKDLGADGDIYVVFEPTQIKSVFNNGQFNSDDPNISYSMNPQPGSRAAAVTESRVVSEISGKLTDMKPSLLKAIPLNYFTELARPNMTAVADYLRVKRLLDAYRGKKHAEADAVAQDWLKHTSNGFMRKDKARAEALASLMHDSTLAGVDPSSIEEEHTSKPAYNGLRKRYIALSPKGRELYNNVRNAYKDQADELDQILLDNVRKAQQIALDKAEKRYSNQVDQIKASGLKGAELKLVLDDAAKAFAAEKTKAQWTMKARITKLRIAFESSRVQEPYFPLARFGRYFVSVKDVNGDILHFSKHESAADRDRTTKQISRQFPGAKLSAGVMESRSAVRDAMDPRIVTEIEEILGNAGVDDMVRDAIWQRYLESMPDLSNRKKFIHRKGVAGYDTDAMRVFASHMFHAAHQMGKVKYGLELQELVNKTQDQAQEADDQTKAMTLANELDNRHEWVMNPTGSKTAQVMTSAAFIWYMAASPASAILNMSQTIMMGAPILGARYGGLVKSLAALSKASKDFAVGRGTARHSSLKADEARALDAFYESGLIDRTQSHDLAGVGETGVEYSPVRARVMGAISWGFHHAERFNREVTALAAYRMARAAGEDEMKAIDSAHDLTWKTHFDYSNASRPTIMQNDLAKVALVFRNYNINMLYRVFRDVHQSIKGESKQARKEARYQLAGVTGMMALMAGVTGSFGFHIGLAIAESIFGDDDDPVDFETRFRADMIDILGPELGGVVLNGVPGHYLGVDLSDRIGMPDLWFRSPSRELQGKAEFDYWALNLLGASVSLGSQLFQGFQLVTEGDVARGIEVAAPKAIRDVMKAYRYSQEGVTTVNGDEVIPADQVGIKDMVKQALGFSPANIAETYDRKNALKNAESRIMSDRKSLMSQFASAVAAKDAETKAEVLEKIKEFNRQPINKLVPITKESLQRSIKTRAVNAAKRQDGAMISNKALGIQLRDALPERVY